MTDPRELPLNDVARKIMVASNYDPHFSAIEERIIMETKLFLARLDAVRAMDTQGGDLYTALADECRQGGKLEPGAQRQRHSLAAFERDLQAVDYRAPIPMILFCPSCGVQHIDGAELETGWDNPPHKSHLCCYCQHIWRPADVPTTGVFAINTSGTADSEPKIRGIIDKTARFQPQWLHVDRQTYYTELGRGELQISVLSRISEGVMMVVYKGRDNRIWVRPATEFDDGRFERVIK